jgi:ribosomal protein S27AE
VKKTKTNLYWKGRYDEVMTKIQELHEMDSWHTHPQPVDCISESNEFWISHSLEVVDSEEAALDHWGEGNFFKVVKTDRSDICPKCGQSVFAFMSGSTNDFTCGCNG